MNLSRGVLRVLSPRRSINPWFQSVGARLVSKGPKKGERSPQASRRKPQPTLKLVRTEAAGPDGILLVYESDGQEHTWLLEQTSSMEFMALLMKGRFKKGRRVVVEGEVALEPPDDAEARPLLCFSSGPLESCVPIDRAALGELRRNIDTYLGAPGRRNA